MPEATSEAMSDATSEEVSEEMSEATSEDVSAEMSEGEEVEHSESEEMSEEMSEEGFEEESEESGTRSVRTTAGRGIWVAAAVLGVVIVGLAATAIVLALAVGDAQNAEDRRTQVESAARQETVNLINVDYKQAQQASDRILSGATGALKDEWATTAAKQFLDAIVKGKAVQTVQTVHAGVVNLDSDSAETIVSISAVVVTPQVPNGVQRNYRFSMELTKVGDRWLVAKVALVP
jgi:membrane-associated HD superfamily phosphohydrolase